MIEIEISTPSILFPAISLLMLAYTNRFLALSQLIRSLHKDYKKNLSFKTLKQINHLKTRVFYVRLMQSLGATSILFCILSISALLLDFYNIGLVCFISSLIIFLGSIISSLIEIVMSTHALNILLEDLKDHKH